MERKPRVALTGDVALELLAPYFRAAGYDVHGPDSPPIEEFAPDFIYDVTSHDAVLEREVPGFRDDRMAALAGCPYSIDGIKAIVDEFRWETVRSPRKALAVDADGTLWKGTLSEDGRDALAPYAEFQEGLRELGDAGVPLVLLSKNDPFEIDWFAVCKANWCPKPENLAEACREMNLPPDAFAFVDDSASERAQMAEMLPGVAIAPFTGWDSAGSGQRQLVRRLKEYFFSDAGRTEEDRLRSRDYAANSLRKSFGGYLAGLGLWVKPSLATEADLDRLAQMAAKTNQFNATTKRRTREELADLVASPSHAVFAFRAGDRFGEQGLVCYVIADLAGRRITDFVMSCRAMGRTLERFVDGYVARQLGYVPEIDFAATPRNAPFAEFLRTRGDARETHYTEVG